VWTIQQEAVRALRLPTNTWRVADLRGKLLSRVVCLFVCLNPEPVGPGSGLESCRRISLRRGQVLNLARRTLTCRPGVCVQDSRPDPRYRPQVPKVPGGGLERRRAGSRRTRDRVPSPRAAPGPARQANRQRLQPTTERVVGNCKRQVPPLDSTTRRELLVKPHPAAPAPPPPTPAPVRRCASTHAAACRPRARRPPAGCSADSGRWR
jgi:hypothetical protein